MKRIFLSFLISICLNTLCLNAQVIKASNLHIIQKEIDHLDQNALVVFDVDWTLIVHKDKVLAPCGKPYFNQCRKEGYVELGVEKIHKLASIVLLNSESMLINEDILTLLANLKTKNIKTIALTAVESGPYGVIPNMEDWRINQLDHFGLSFRDAFPGISGFTLEKCQGEKCPAVFKEGILYSGKYPKGEVLVAFLEKMECRPSKIIFVDDKLDFIETVESHCNAQKIPVISFHYTEALELPWEFDKNLGMHQWNFLKENEIWLSDEEAKAMILLPVNAPCLNCNSK